MPRGIVGRKILHVCIHLNFVHFNFNILKTVKRKKTMYYSLCTGTGFETAKFLFCLCKGLHMQGLLLNTVSERLSHTLSIERFIFTTF